MTQATLRDTREVHQPLFDLFAQQQQQYSAYPLPTYEERVSRLKALKKAVLVHKKALVSAMSADFDYRSEHDSLIGDILPVISQINYTLKKLRKWMQPSKRHAGLLLAPASVRVEYQPKGVIGVVAPWNFPVMLSLSPLVTSIAAGNRTMIKVSEFTPETNRVLIQLVSSIFAKDEVAIIEGEAEIASTFTSLPFDHILFTGSTPVGKHVMRAAADNLTPVTLELGGKSPVIIGEDIPIKTAVERIIFGKCLNAGQICVSPDYVICPKNRIDEFVAEYQAKFQRLYPDFNNNDDYSQIINTRQAERVASLLQDALDKGATIHSAGAELSVSTSRKDPTEKILDTVSKKWPTQLILNISNEMRVMQEEIFGPLLPIVPYESLSEAIELVKHNPRPLALYLMSYDKSVQRQVLEQTHSGGVCINETVFHVAAEDAPFGGVGLSGIGHYHGIEGFKTLSHAKTVLQRGNFNSGKFIHPPYGNILHKLILKFFLR